MAPDKLKEAYRIVYQDLFNHGGELIGIVPRHKANSEYVPGIRKVMGQIADIAGYSEEFENEWLKNIDNSKKGLRGLAVDDILIQLGSNKLTRYTLLAVVTGIEKGDPVHGYSVTVKEYQCFGDRVYNPYTITLSELSDRFRKCSEEEISILKSHIGSENIFCNKDGQNKEELVEEMDR